MLHIARRARKHARSLDFEQSALSAVTRSLFVTNRLFTHEALQPDLNSHPDAKLFPDAQAFEGETPDLLSSGDGNADFTTTFAGIASSPFSDEAIVVLNQPVNEEDIEVKPDGLLYLPEIKYRRILNKAFGPGGWGLVPRFERLI
jgi:Mitochondrial genome maintenance MGM101